MKIFKFNASFLIRLIIFLFICASNNLALSHPIILDSQGGHADRKTNEYHCYKEPCFTNQKQVEQAHQNAVDSGAAMSIMYFREDWPHWIDADNDCQDTRAEILIASSSIPVKFKRNNGCNVSWGKWFDPYTGRTFEKASELDIDHIVPLAHAHRNGGAEWPRDKKRQFANDPDNLIAVDKSANRSKSDQAPNDWMPPKNEDWCEYIKKWKAVKAKYKLFASSDEVAFIDKIERICKH